MTAHFPAIVLHESGRKRGVTDSYNLNNR